MLPPSSSPSPTINKGWEQLYTRLQQGDPVSISLVLNFLDDERKETQEVRYRFLTYLYERRRSETLTLGVTGPPGVGKSTLTGALIRTYRQQKKTVGVIAVDPSSSVSGGALLGDRIRMQVGADPGVFIRSLASRGHTGGLSDFSYIARVVMEVVFERVIIETVGVGQSDEEVLHAADVVLLVLQPESGDSIQFLKAGIIEIPHIIVLNKMDLEGSEYTLRELRSMLGIGGDLSGRKKALHILPCQASTGKGIRELVEKIEELGKEKSPDVRYTQWLHWLIKAIEKEFGKAGIRTLGGEEGIRRRFMPGSSPFLLYQEIHQEMTTRLPSIAHASST